MDVSAEPIQELGNEDSIDQIKEVNIIDNFSESQDTSQNENN